MVKLHNSILTIPTYQFEQLCKTGDLRYLLWFDNKSDLFNLPEIQLTKEFALAYDKIIKSIEYIDVKSQIYLFNLHKSFIIWLGYKSQENLTKYNNAFWKYFDFVKVNYKMIKYKNEKIKDLTEFYKDQKTKIREEKKDFFYERYFIINSLEFESSGDIFEYLIYLRQIDANFDLFKDSYHYFKICLKALKKQNAKNTKKTTK